MKVVIALLATGLLFAVRDGTDTRLAAVDTTAPVVSNSRPVNAATGVPRNPTLTATFSEAMSPATINATTFVLTAGGNAIPGTVSYAGVMATFIPASPLAANTVYSATISTGVKDVAGNAMAVAKNWTFTTVTGSPTGPAAVSLGNAGNYAIVAKSGVSTTGTTAIVGDIAISPAAASSVTGFAMTADSSHTFSTSSLVKGRIWAANYTAPTPASLSTAVMDMRTAYNDAVGRTLPDYLELGAGNINGMTLSPGLYKWSTGVTLPSAVTLTGGANDVFIFQIARDLTVGNGAVVTLSGGVQPGNVFWQVAGQATLGTTASFQGIIMSRTLISLNTGATLTGRALAQTAVTLNSTAITHP